MRKSITKALAAATAATALAVPSTLLCAGTAHADTRILDVTPGPLGVIVHISNMSKSPGWCRYTATPVDSLLPPFHSLPFHVDGQGNGDSTFDLVMPGVATGSSWIPSVACDNGASQDTFWEGKPAPIVY